jgi:formylglycine-generating enzyme
MIWLAMVSLALSAHRLAVLDLEGFSEPALRTLAADAVRSGALEIAKPLDLMLISRENLLLVVSEMESAECSQGACEIDLGRSIGADYVVSGSLGKLDGAYALSLNLHETVGGRLLSSVQEWAGSGKEVAEMARQSGSALLREGLAPQEAMLPHVQSARYSPYKAAAIPTGGSYGARDAGGMRRYLHVQSELSAGVAEVSEELYRAISGGSHAQGCGSLCPASGLSLFDAAEFANSLSEEEGLEACYEIARGSIQWKRGCLGWRVPTDEEWEYLAVAGQDFPYAGSGNVDAAAWYSANSSGLLHPSGEKKPNAYGLQDMSGNLWEWVWPDGVGVVDGRTPCTLRGGSYLDGAALGTAKRASPGRRDPVFGLRLVRGAG